MYQIDRNNFKNNQLAEIKKWADELTHLETNLSQSQTAKERQSLIANHPLNKYGFGFSEEVKLLLILKGLEIEFQLAHDKLNIKNLALLIAGITSEIFWKRKQKLTDC